MHHPHRSVSIVLLAALERTLGAQGVTRSGSELVLVACSGGVDSVALAHGASILLGARRVVLGHVDHAVRPTSGADADGVVEFAAALGVAVRVTRLSPGPDDEASLRDARYAALEAQRADVGAQWILTAHTQNDQAETVLMGLFRSASPRALGGMPGVRGRLIRPLLSVSRDQLVAHVCRHQLPVFEDATNREPRYLRNRVRKELMPLIETRYRARLVPRLAALADRMRGLLDARSRSHLMTPESDISPSPHSLSAWSEGRTWLKMERQPWSGQEPPNGQNEAVFDAKHIVSPRIRMLRPGDRIQPFGMTGHRKLRDLLREQGIAAEDRTGLPVVVDRMDRVLWLPGAGRSALAPVTGTTREVWWFSIGQDHELQANESQATL